MRRPTPLTRDRNSDERGFRANSWTNVAGSLQCTEARSARRRSPSDAREGSESSQEGASDPFDSREIVDALEASELAAKREDRTRARGTDARKPLQVVLSRDVEIDDESAVGELFERGFGCIDG